MTLSAIEIHQLEAQHTAVVRIRLPLADAGRIPELLQLTLRHIQAGGQQPAGMPFVRSFSMSTDPLDIEVGWPVATPLATGPEATQPEATQPGATQPESTDRTTTGAPPPNDTQPSKDTHPKATRPTDQVTASRLPAGPAAVASYFGPYDRIAPAYDAIRDWCATHHRQIAGPPWESYFTDPTQEPDPARWRTDIHFPLAA